MNIYLINNRSANLPSIVERLNEGGHKFKTLKYNGKYEFNPVRSDLIIISGGPTNVLDKDENGGLYYQAQIDFIKQSKIPIFGICLGFQLCGYAFGATLRQLNKRDDGVKLIYLNKSGKDLFDVEKIDVLEHHEWTVSSITGTEYTALSLSESGYEMIYDPKRKIIGTQFHPERITDKSSKIFWEKLLTLFM